MMSAGDNVNVFLGSVDNNQLSDAEKQALLDSAVHEAKWVDQDGKKRLACAACTKTFSDRGHLRTHYNTVHLKTMYKCTVVGCEEWFSSMRARQRHIQSTHTQRQPAGTASPQHAQPMRQPAIQPQPVVQPHSQQMLSHGQLFQHHTAASAGASTQGQVMLPQQAQVIRPQQAQPVQVFQQPQASQHYVQQTNTTMQAVHPIQAQPVAHQVQQQQSFQPQYQQQQPQPRPQLHHQLQHQQFQAIVAPQPQQQQQQAVNVMSTHANVQVTNVVQQAANANISVQHKQPVLIAGSSVLNPGGQTSGLPMTNDVAKQGCPEHNQSLLQSVAGHQCNFSNPTLTQAQPTATACTQQVATDQRAPYALKPEAGVVQPQFVQPPASQARQLGVQQSPDCHQHPAVGTAPPVHSTELRDHRLEASVVTAPLAAVKRPSDGLDPNERQPPAKIAATAAASSSAQSRSDEDDLDEPGEMDIAKRERQARERAAQEANETLGNFLNRLQELDVNDYFAYPMTEITHPGCTTQLDRLSDLYSVRLKLRRGHYTSASGLRLLRDDLDLVFSNAMKYYAEKSPQYRLSAKLWKTAEDGLSSLLADLAGRYPHLFGPASESNGAGALAADERTTTLGFLQPCNRGRVGKQHRVMTIGEEIGRPANCVGPQPPLRDDRRNKIIPVSYLDYGSFSSFAPTFDSGAAYCTKEDSDLVLGQFGPLANGSTDRLAELNEDNALVVPERELGDDNAFYMINAFTLNILREEAAAGAANDGAESMTLEDLLVDDAALSSVGKEEEEEEEEEQQQDYRLQPPFLLADTASKLGSLREANYQRLSQAHSRVAHTPASDEQALAERVAASLALMVGRNKPDDVVSTAALHRSMQVDLAASTAAPGPSGSGSGTVPNAVACGEA